MINYVYENTKMKNLCLGGGVALNGVANTRLLKEGPFENIHIPPSPGDAGSAVGCAQFLYYSYNNQKRVIEKNQTDQIQENIYVGPSFQNDEIEKFLTEHKIQFTRLERNEILKETAKLISEKNVVGWYQGKMEWGPRALGNRSILADPRDGKMKDVLNQKIKHRESFRPFAPSILKEFESEYFDLDVPSPYMLLVAKVKKPNLEAYFSDLKTMIFENKNI